MDWFFFLIGGWENTFWQQKLTKNVCDSSSDLFHGFFSLKSNHQKNQQAQRHFILPLTEHHLEHIRTSFTWCMCCAEVLVCRQYNNLLSCYLSMKKEYFGMSSITPQRLVSLSSPSVTFGCEIVQSTQLQVQSKEPHLEWKSKPHFSSQFHFQERVD